jgi:hypothetical protein
MPPAIRGVVGKRSLVTASSSKLINSSGSTIASSSEPKAPADAKNYAPHLKKN